LPLGTVIAGSPAAGGSGALAQGAFLLDYIFSRGRVGAYITAGFKNTAVLNRIQIGPGSFLETYAQVANQVGGSALVGTWGHAYIEGNIGWINSHLNNNSPGGQIRLVQPISEHFAFTVEGALNETYLASTNSGRIGFGFQMGNYIHPRDYGKTKSPVPMDVPRVRYELLTRRVAGATPPVANAGPIRTVLRREPSPLTRPPLTIRTDFHSPTRGRRLAARA
jgi:hypothetical protein